MCLYEPHLLTPFLTIPPDHTSVVRRIAGKRLFGDYRRRAIQNLFADFELLEVKPAARGIGHIDPCRGA